jgi:hypothetical protein
MKFTSVSRHQIYLIWCVALFFLVLLLIEPISYTVMRWAIAILVATIWLGSLYLWWERVIFRIGILAVGAFFGLFLILPGRPINTESLRAEYIDSLKIYEGTAYVWGGENRLGIDCSGLVREGLIQANLQQGFTTFNSTLVRQGLLMWWFDLSAMALRDGANGWTYKLFRSESINAIDSTKLLPGDLATTIDGQHILAYIGKDRWIEADPGYHKTIIVTVPEPNNFWFQTPVHILRWRQLAR